MKTALVVVMKEKNAHVMTIANAEANALVVAMIIKKKIAMKSAHVVATKEKSVLVNKNSVSRSFFVEKLCLNAQKVFFFVKKDICQPNIDI